MTLAKIKKIHDDTNVQQTVNRVHIFGGSFCLLSETGYLFLQLELGPKFISLSSTGPESQRLDDTPRTVNFSQQPSRDITLDPLFIAEEMSGMTGPVMILASWLTSSAPDTIICIQNIYSP